jgi:hypothetical protein
MVRNIFKNLAFSFILTTIIIYFLFWTHLINKIWFYIKKIRVTGEYEGESKGMENLNITEGIIIPVLFLLSFIVVMVIRRKRRNKSKKAAHP